MEEKQLVTIAEAVRLSGLSRQTIMRRINAGEISQPKPMNPRYKKGGRLGIPRAEVLALLPPEAR